MMHYSERLQPLPCQHQNSHNLDELSSLFCRLVYTTPSLGVALYRSLTSKAPVEIFATVQYSIIQCHCFNSQSGQIYNKTMQYNGQPESQSVIQSSNANITCTAFHHLSAPSTARHHISFLSHNFGRKVLLLFIIAIMIQVVVQNDAGAYHGDVVLSTCSYMFHLIA